MKKDKPIFLVGFMGSGKSTVGKELAKYLGRRFIDTDQEVVKTVGCSIVSIFKKQGEKGFRVKEDAAIRAASRQARSVVAVGGGANIAALGRVGTVVYLQAPLSVLARRIGGGASRPLWKNAQTLFNKRVGLYNRASHFRIRSAVGSPAVIAARVARRLE